MAFGKELIKSRWVLEAAGFSLLLSGPWYYPMLFPGNVAIYHHRLEFRSMVCGIFLVVAVIFILSLAALLLLSRVPKQLHALIEAIATGVCLWLFLQTLASLYFENLMNQVNGVSSGAQAHEGIWSFLSALVIAQSTSLIFTLPACLALLAVLKIEGGAGVARAVRLVLASFAFCGIWIVPQLSYLAFGLRPVPSFNRLEATSGAPDGPPKRIIWIVFDELSQNLIVDHPPAGLSFPEFDAFRTTSVNFSNVEPVGFYTDRVIPSILAGIPIGEISNSTNGKMHFRDPSGSGWVGFDASKTLFAAAYRRGMNPSVAGWHIPYCRTYSNVLSACSWQVSANFMFPLENLTEPENNSMFENAWIMASHFVPPPFISADKPSSIAMEIRMRGYRRIMSDARKLIRDPRTGFVLIHIPVPHPPGFFDRNTHQVCACGNYIDNLVLTEETLAELLQEIHQTPHADQTSIIVSSDHSWRAPMWRSVAGWTNEEERISEGQFDRRPVLLIKFPGQKAGYSITQTTPELVEHDILAALIEGDVSSPQQLMDAFHFQPTVTPDGTDIVLPR